MPHPDDPNPFDELGDQINDKIDESFQEARRDKGKEPDQEPLEEVPPEATIESIQEGIDELHEEERGGDQEESEVLESAELGEAADTLESDIDLDKSDTEEEVEQEATEDRPMEEAELQSPVEPLRNDVEMQQAADILQDDIPEPLNTSVPRSGTENLREEPLGYMELEETSISVQQDIDLDSKSEEDEGYFDLDKASQVLEEEVDIVSPGSQSSRREATAPQGAQSVQVEHTINLVVTPSDDLAQQIADKALPLIQAMMADLQAQTEDAIGYAVELSDRGGTIA